MFCGSCWIFGKKLPGGFGTIILHQGSGFRTFFVPGVGNWPIQKTSLGFCPGGMVRPAISLEALFLPISISWGWLLQVIIANIVSITS